MKQSKIWTPLVLGTCLIAAVSCGSDDDDSGSGVQAPQQEEQNDQGTYNVTFAPLNAGVGGNAASGTGTITITETNFQVNLNMTGVPARVSHIQSIHASGSCPTAAADVNADGFVDVVEGLPSYGPILIPLDGNLNSQLGGNGSRPRSDASGAYNYSRRGTLSRMLDDLRGTDTNTTDVLTKLPEGENLNLENKVIIVHGVPASTDLPDTVASLPNLPSEATLPIACGTITRAPSDGGTGTTTGETGTTTTTGTTGGTGTTTTTGETGTTTGGTGTTTGTTGTTTTTGGTGTTTGTTGSTGTTTTGTTGTGTGTTTGA